LFPPPALHGTYCLVALPVAQGQTGLPCQALILAPEGFPYGEVLDLLRV
jgi:hypothetical protein